MLLPVEIKGKNRIRDFKICELYLAGMTPIEIFDTLRQRQRPLSLRRIQSILSDNTVFINPLIGWNKTKRLHKLQRIAEKLPDRLSPSKDILNVIEQIRTEIDGEAPLVDQSTHYHITKLSDEQLIEHARKTGISLPPSIQARIEQASNGQSN